MKQYNFTTKSGITYGRASRTMAKKAFDRGEIIYFCADKMRPDGMWAGGVAIHNKLDVNKTFEQYEHEFAFYNCRPETGLRIAFYAEVKQ